jgi:hypothetical protein
MDKKQEQEEKITLETVAMAIWRFFLAYYVMFFICKLIGIL